MWWLNTALVFSFPFFYGFAFSLFFVFFPLPLPPSFLPSLSMSPPYSHVKRVRRKASVSVHFSLTLAVCVCASVYTCKHGRGRTLLRRCSVYSPSSFNDGKSTAQRRKGRNAKAQRSGTQSALLLHRAFVFACGRPFGESWRTLDVTRGGWLASSPSALNTEAQFLLWIHTRTHIHTHTYIHS